MSIHNSDLLDFLKGIGRDSRGRVFWAYFTPNDRWWEETHDFIQWAFPLPEPSKAQPQSPVATQEDYDVIANDPVLKARMIAMLGRYILFLDRTTAWRGAADHNHMRITRVIRCLCLCGLNDLAFDFCDYIKDEVGDIVGKSTLNYWDEALKRNPAWLEVTQ